MTKRFLQLELGEALKIEATSEGRFPTWGRGVHFPILLQPQPQAWHKALFSESLGTGQMGFPCLPFPGWEDEHLLVLGPHFPDRMGN